MTHRTNGVLRLVFGLILVALGVLFLLAELFNVSLWRYLWPLFILVPGVLFFAGMVTGGPKVGGLAIPGSIITATGLLLLYQNTTGHWQSWAYAWSLIFPISLGIGLWINGRWSGDDHLQRDGAFFMKLGLAIFLLAGMFFELLLNISGFRSSLVGKVLWPVLLVVFGLYLAFGTGLGAKNDRGSDGGSQPGAA